MMHVEEALAYCFASVEGIGRKSIFQLYKEAGSMEDILNLSHEEMCRIAGKRQGSLFYKEFVGGNGFEAMKKDNVRRGLDFYGKLKRQGISYVSFLSPAYPERLRNIPDPPFGIYVKGALPQSEVPSVAIIGARACSEYGKRCARVFAEALSEAGVQIISGMARGVDGIGQERVAKLGGKTFAVLGNGVDVCYPEEHRELYQDIMRNGGIISEYRPGVAPRSNLFPERNRIISGLADLILVIEARRRSGTYITVTQALEQGKDVFAVPGRITDALSDGCNFLLKEGAGFAADPKCILQELEGRTYKNWVYDEALRPAAQRGSNQKAEPREKDKPGADIDSEECSLRQCVLMGLELTPVHVQSIFERARANLPKEISLAEVSLELTRLQCEGVVEGSGGFYRMIP